MIETRQEPGKNISNRGLEEDISVNSSRYVSRRLRIRRLGVPRPTAGQAGGESPQVHTKPVWQCLTGFLVPDHVLCIHYTKPNQWQPLQGNDLQPGGQAKATQRREDENHQTF